MAASPRAFRIGLYEEHLEEASFLFEQRRTLLVNPEVPWKKIGDFEDRLEAHIDALIVGDKLALDVCVRHASGDDFGELFAATSVFGSTPSAGPTLARSASSALPEVIRTAGITPAAVVLPPDAPLNG